MDQLKSASQCIMNTESIVKYSFIVMKSVAYLDLSLCELSVLKGKRKPNHMITPFSIVDTSNFVCTEEGCRKKFSVNRKILYDFHLDVSVELELHLRSNQNDQRRFYSDAIFLNSLSIVDIWFIVVLQKMAIHALQETNDKVKLLHEISKASQRIHFIGKNGYIRAQGSDILFHQCRDSNIVKEFLTVADFGDGYLLRLRPEVVEYLLYHASCSGYIFRDHHNREDLINSAICSRKFKVAELLLMYRDSPMFCEFVYDEMKRNLGSERDLNPFFNFRNSYNLQKRERLFWFLQVFHVFHFDPDSGLKSLQMVWRAIPYAFLNAEELTTVYPELQGTEYMKDITKFFDDIAGKETVYPEPRSLKHYCRTAVRKALSMNAKLLTGIDQLDLPLPLASYLKLEF